MSTNSTGDGSRGADAADAPRLRHIPDPAVYPGSVRFTGYAGRVGTGRTYPRPLSRDQRTTVVYGILCFILILLVLQLWLLVATMNAFLGGDESVIWPAAAASEMARRELAQG